MHGFFTRGRQWDVGAEPAGAASAVLPRRGATAKEAEEVADGWEPMSRGVLAPGLSLGLEPALREETLLPADGPAALDAYEGQVAAHLDHVGAQVVKP